MKWKRWVITSTLVPALLAPFTAVEAQYFSAVPNTIVDGTTSNATQVNQNFSALVGNGNTAIATIQASLAALPSIGFPTGTVFAYFNGPTCPQGSLVANGQNGTIDLRGVYLRGLDNGRGLDPGRTLGSFQGDTVANHSHGNLGLLGTPPTNSQNVNIAVSGITQIASLSTLASVTQASTGGVETRPLTFIIMWCVEQ